MRVMRRRQVIVFVVAAVFAVGLWAWFSRLSIPRVTMRRFQVHGSAEFYSLLLDNSPANCSARQPYKMDMPASDHNVLIDIHNFKFQMNPPPCQGQPVLLALVHSAPNNTEKRLQIRKTWGSILQGALLFVLGEVDSPLLQVLLESENDRYHDLLQGSFKDTYRNMTYKHIMALKWVLYYCPGVRYVLKADDDTFVNTPVLMRALAQGRPRCGMKKLILCRVWRGVKVERKRNKWTVTQKEFHDNVYPDYCSGTAILYSQASASMLMISALFWDITWHHVDVVYALYRKAQVTPYFWVDDVHVTGTLVKNLNVTHQPALPVTLGIIFMPNNTIMCNHRKVRNMPDTPPWVQSFLFSRHNMTASDMESLWQYVNKCTALH